MDEFIQEVEEDLKRERQLELWRKYGKYAVGLVLLAVIIASSIVGWRNYQQTQRYEQGLKYATALDLVRADKSAAAIPAFAELAGEAGGGYAELARLQEAALLAKSGDGAGAVAVYERLIADSGANRIFRDLALILLALTIADNADPQALTGRLEPLTVKDNPWRHSALEVTALLHLRARDEARAREIFTTLADDTTAPRNMRARASEMLASLGKGPG
jgi:hypothetical protein